VYERLGEIPKAGDTLQVGKATLTVEAIRGQRIQTVRITSTEPILLAEQRNGAREERHPEEQRAAHG
jgi:Mg2+/Co2+ transporter CorC